MKSSKIIKLLGYAGVPVDLHPQALTSLLNAQDRAKGLNWKKLKTRLFKAGPIAEIMLWEHNRLIEAVPEWAEHDIAPMLNITGHGDNGPWVETPEGGRPIENYWLNTDPQSQEYQDAVRACYWCPGHHPRSRKAREAWYRRNGGEYLAWSKGQYVDPTKPVERWSGTDGRYTVSVVRCGEAWIIRTSYSLIGKLKWEGRYGFEADNVFSGPLAPQMWYPIPGYQLRAPVTWGGKPAWN